MYTNIFFSGFKSLETFEVSSKSSFNSEKNSGFDAFLNKYQNSDFEFIKGSSSEAVSEIKDLTKLEDPNEKVIGLIVERMKEVLRNASKGSSFVSFSYTEISSLRQVLISSENLSMEEIDNALSSDKNTKSYLPDLFSSIDSLDKEKIDSKEVYFPFSFVPYFATALESIGVNSADIRSTIESSLDMEKGFSLKGLLDSIDEIKSKAIKTMETLGRDNKDLSFENACHYELLSNLVKGIETIESVFELPQDKNSFIEIDKNSINNFMAAIEKRLNQSFSDLELYKKSLDNSSKNKEAEFVKNLFNEEGQLFVKRDFNEEGQLFVKRDFNEEGQLFVKRDFNEEGQLSVKSYFNEEGQLFVKRDFNEEGQLSVKRDFHEEDQLFVKSHFNEKDLGKESFELTRNIFEDSFASWKRNQRVLSEENLKSIQADYQLKVFEKSHEYSFFANSPIDQPEIKALNLSTVLGLNSSFNELIQASVRNDKLNFTLEGSGGEEIDINIKSLLEMNLKNLKKEKLNDFSEDRSDFMKNSLTRNSGGVSKAAQPGSGASLSKQIMEQIEKQILRTVRLGEKEVSFRLNPPDLGRLHLRIESVRNGLNIKIIAEKNSTHELMVQQAQEFKNQLQSQGMQVAEVNVELAHNFDQAMARERKNSFENQSKNKGISGVKAKNNSKENAGLVKKKMFFSDKAVDLIA
ncbi:MAG: flagellar hook-length control protein FliK [Desulforegulaceae bacterium]|nr:flagellar hook-length control protein FliK [Desulforegulaceae bacterium]